MSNSNYLKILDEIKGRAYGNSGANNSSNASGSSNNEQGSSSMSILEEIKARANGTYKGTSSTTSQGMEGFKKYLEDEEAKKNAAIAEEEEKSWWEKFLGNVLESQRKTPTDNPIVNSFSSMVDHYKEDVSYMRPNDDWNEEQKSKFGEIYLVSPEKAYSYAEETNKENNKKKEAAQIQKIQDSATDNGWAGAGHTAGAIAAAPFALGDFFDDLARTAAGREITSDGFVSPFEYSQAVTGGISTHLNQKGTVDLGILGERGWGDVYSLGTSIAQSMVSAYTLGSAGTLISYFGQGAAAGVDEALARGASDDQAILYGAALGTFEGVAEMIGIDNLFKLGSASTLKGLVKNVLKQSAAEGLEEGFTAITSEIADRFIMKDKSNFAIMVNELMAQGMSESEAKKKAWMSTVGDIAFDTIAGAVSGGVSGSIHTGVQTVKDNANAKKVYGENTQDLVTEALEIDPNNAYAQQMQGRIDKGKSLSGGQINRLVETNENALVSQDKGKMKSAVESRLTELGETSDVSKLADVIVKAQMGEKLTSVEKKALSESAYGEWVAEELNPDSVNKGFSEDYSNWAESLGTERINVEAYNRAVQDYSEETENASVTENTPVKENAVEGKILAPTGKVNQPVAKATMVDNEGNEIEAKVAKIVDVESGEASLELEGGQIVKASEVDFGDSGIGLVYNVATEMVSGVGGFNVDAANVMVRGFNPSGSVQAASTYVTGFNEAYRYGAMGYPVSALATGNATSKIGVSQREAAYNLGKAYGAGKVAAKQANIDSAKANKTGQKAKKGRVYFDGSAVGKTLTERQRASLKGLQVVAEAMGIDIHIFESKVVDGKRQGANGWYDPSDNSIHLDLYAGVGGNGLMLFTASHELGHHIREVAPAKFKVFADALLEEYAKSGVSIDGLISRKLETLEANGRLEGKTKEQAYDLAYEEVVADASESMLVDSNAMEALSKKIQAKDKGLWETIKDFITKLVNRIREAYKGLDPDSREGKLVREMKDSAEKLQKLWVDALLEASEVSTEQTLGESGIIVNSKTESASLMSVRDVLSDADRKKVAKALAERFGVTQAEAMDWLKAETSLASLILNPKYSQYLDYTGDPNEEAIKSNSDYPQGTVDFSNICKKRRDFTEVMNRVLRNFPNHVFAATDLAKIRTIMEQEGMEVACAICYVEDRRQLDSVVAQDFIDSLALYRKGSKTRPDGKAFNANQLKALKLVEGDSYTPSIYELISLEGRNSLKAKNPTMEEAWVKFNNARGMQSVRLLLNDAEYKRQILKYSPSVVKRKNEYGGLRIYSFSDMEMFHLIDIIQVLTDSATVGLSVQGYTKVNEYAKAVKDTGEKLNRSLIPKGDLGYHMENGRVVLDFDTVEGIDINHPDFFDNIDNPNVGNIVIGINATQIKAAMTSKFIDQIIPFHTGQSSEVLGEKGIAAWENYKDFQSERDASTKKKSSHQINIYTEVINAAEAEGHPITNKVEFVNKFLQVCKENNLIPRFSDFLNVDENGDYVYTEGYHKFLVDFKTFDQNTGEYLPQMPVKPIFDNEYITKLLTDYVKAQQVKDAELKKAMPKVLDRITKEIVKNDGVKYSDRADALDKSWEKRYNLYTATDEFYRDVPYGIREEFARSLANKTAGMADGEIRTIYVAGYIFEADGYMQGHILAPYTERTKKLLEVKKNIYDEINQDREIAPVWTEAVRDAEGGSSGDSDISRRGRSGADDRLLGSSSERNTSRDNERIWTNPRTKEDYDEIIKKLREMYGLDAVKYSDRDTASFKGKAFWSGSVSLLDGVIEEVHTIEEAEDADFHHSMYFSQAQVEKMANEENAFFFVENGEVQGDWRVSIPDDIIERIKEQIEVSPSIVEAREFSDADIKYSIREEEPPKKTKEGYKVFVVKNGKLYPPMVANPNAEDTPVGVWLNADVGTRAPDSKTGRMQVKAGGKGTQGGSGSLAFRPGWHLGETPLATQFDRLNPETGVKELFPENFVWALCDIAADHDYQEEAMSYGYTKNGKFQHSLAGLPKLPTDGYYKYRTNPNPDTVPWLITGAMKVKKLLSDAEVNAILEEKGLAPKQRVGGEKTLAGLGLSEYEGKVFQDRNPDSYSNRSLLAGALETAVQNDIEREKLRQYKAKIDLINAEEQKLHDLREQIKELSFKKGPRDTEAIRKLQFEANQAANRINTYDKQLLNLESTKALKGVLEREKAQARKRDAQKYKEALERYREKSAKTQRELMDRYQESRKRGVENRNKTAMRHKIKEVVNDLNNYLLKGTKDKHVPIELQKAVAEALDAVNMDTVGAEERIAKLKAEMMRAKTPEAMQDIAKKIDHIEEMGGNMAKKISRLKTAYDSIINSDDPLVANSHDDVISSTIEKVMEYVGETPLRDMSLPQLEAVYDMYRMVLHSIRAANKAFKAKKSEEISVIANRVMEEIDKLGKKKALQSKAGQTISEFDWNNQKPIYAFERIGSDTFTEVFNNVRAGEDTWAMDMSEAQDFREEQYKKHKYDSWDTGKRFGFTSTSGMRFELNLEQIMSLYAYSKRDQAADHLKYGGIVFDPKTEVVVATKTGIKVKQNLTDATSYNISEQTLADIISKLTAEQKAFVDEMQDYLSTVMGEKGNEVSLEMYGVKLFKEKNYFPLKSAQQYMAKAKEQAQGEIKVKNSGFSKETKPHAKNPIVLSSFMDVWAGHVNEMSMYHAFVLPLEDFYRVFNYTTPSTNENLPVEGVNPAIENAHGAVATRYIEQLLKDLNGGARVDSTVGIINKLTGMFKKSAVFASASVVVQQPSAIARATALVDTKYFVGKPSKHKETWAEVKKYAPVAVIKEMGYFDTGMGKSSVEWLKGEETFMDKVDDIASKAPALADEYAWCAIWNAVKRETVHNNPNLKTSSDEFLKLVGERFTEVIVKTQVYDSVLSRSANMRSKDTGMKMATAFMGEPTTSLNMLENALIQAKRGNKKAAAKAVGGVIASMILNSILVSIVYAGRDDDEDKTYAEKYISTLTEELLDSFNPLTLIPFVKDIVSIVQGYDVERSDMAVITDLINAWNNLDSDNRSVYRKVEDFGGAIASIFGLPVKNVMRDVRGMYNTVNSFINGEKTTGAGIGNAVKEAITGKESSNGQQLYEAMLKGDTEQIERVKGRFKNQSDIDSAIRKAIKEAYTSGDIDYDTAMDHLIEYGSLEDEDEAYWTIDGWDYAVENGSSEDYSKYGDFYTAVETGKNLKAVIKRYTDNGVSEKTLQSQITSHFKDTYTSMSKSQRASLKGYLRNGMTYCGMTQDEANARLQYWDFIAEYPGYDLTESAVSKYYSDVKPSGISVDVYYDYTKQRAKAQGEDLNGDGKTDSGSVKREVMWIIHSLPISSYQKDALYYLNGWSASTIWEAPWH